MCNLYKDTIGRAVKVLNEGGWLRLRYGRYGAKSWYRITLLVKDFPLCPQKPDTRKVAGAAKTRHKDPSPCVRKNPPLLSRESKDGQERPALPASLGRTMAVQKTHAVPCGKYEPRADDPDWVKGVG